MWHRVGAERDAELQLRVHAGIACPRPRLVMFSFLVPSLLTGGGFGEDTGAPAPAPCSPALCTEPVGACDNRQHISRRRGASFPACHRKHKQLAGTQQGASVSLRAEPVSHGLPKSARRMRRRKDAQGAPHLQADALFDWREGERRSQGEDSSPLLVGLCRREQVFFHFPDDGKERWQERVEK